MSTNLIGRTVEAFVPRLAAQGRLRAAAARIVVVIAGPNPSFDYYLRPRLECEGALPFVVVDIRDAPQGAAAAALLDGAFVLFCRYMSGAWLDLVESRAQTIAGVGLFVDDDMEALSADAAIPIAYRTRLARLALIHRRRLARVLDILFVANPVLAARYEHAHPRILTPLASEADRPLERRPSGDLRVAIHSTSVHAAEIRWLLPVMRTVLDAERSLTLEIVAGPLLGLRWRRLPRTEVIAPRKWPAFRSYGLAHGADLLLAPLVPGRANAARSATKRIDAMRLGAALLISDPAVYRPGDEELALGMCVPFDAKAWVEAIRSLAHDRERLARLRALNRAHVMASATARPLLADEGAS